MRKPFRAAAALGAACALLLSAVAALAQGQGPPGGDEPRPVGVVEIATEPVPFSVELPGRAVAFEQADIRPRVEGVVEEIAYLPGHQVSVGDVLFRLERDTYEAVLAAAEAEVAQAEGAARAAEATLDRYRRLEGAGVTSETVESAEVAQMQSQATLKKAQAALKTAQLDLARTEIRSPIDGVADVPAVSVGALVTANQAEALTTVTRLDPIYVDVAESSARMLRVRERIAAGTLHPGDRIGMKLTLESGEIYGATGEIVSPGVIVSRTTGTLNIRVRFPNPDRNIIPGQFLRVEATLGTTQGILVPQIATRRSSTGVLTAFVARGAEAVQVTLTSAGTYGSAWVTTAGLEPGELLIVDGLRGLRSGDPVAPIPVTIDADGVARPVEGG